MSDHRMSFAEMVAMTNGPVIVDLASTAAGTSVAVATLEKSSDSVQAAMVRPVMTSAHYDRKWLDEQDIDGLRPIAGHFNSDYRLGYEAFKNGDPGVRVNKMNRAELIDFILTEDVIELPADLSPKTLAELNLDADLAKDVARLRRNQRAREILKEQEERKLNRKPLDIATLDELLARPAPTWRIKSREKVNVPGTGDGLIQAESNTTIVGIAKVGKTTLLGNLIYSLITGKPFLGHYDEVRPVTGSVVVLNYEVSGPTYAWWLRDMGVPNEHLHIINLRGAANPFDSERGKDELIKALIDKECEVLIVDPFTRAFTGDNQNDANQVQKWTRILDEIKLAAGVQDAIVAVHAGWEGERARGSSELVVWPDSIITMTRKGDDRYLSAEGRHAPLAETKLNWDGKNRRLELGKGNRRTAQAEQKVGDLPNDVVEAIAAMPGMSFNKLYAELQRLGVHASRAAVAAARDRACELKLIEIRQEGNNTQAHYPANAATADANLLHLVPGLLE